MVRDVIEEVDVVVIGMGPGGEDAAGRLASAGLDVVGVESRLVGGECPYFACVPTKMMVRAAETLAEAGRATTLSGAGTIDPQWTLVADRIRNEATTNWDDRIAVERFESTGGRLVRGRGRITAPAEVTVSTDNGERVFRTRRGILLNPGTEPSVPPIDALAWTPYWTSRQAVTARSVPESLLVLGGGPVGLEFAQVFARFGAEVTILEAGSRLLGHGEPEASEAITAALRAEGLRVDTGVTVHQVNHTGTEFTAELDSGETLTAQRFLVAAGRHTDLTALGVKAVGLDDTARTIPVDERMRAADGVWAIGDVSGHGAFTHTSMYQARIATDDILGLGGETADYRAMPAVTFTDPEVAAVGRTEAEARDEGITVRTATTSVASSARGWIHRGQPGDLIKLVLDAERNTLVGATVVAPYGGEIMGALAVAIQGAVPVDQLRRMIFAYPTFHRAIEDALNGLCR